MARLLLLACIGLLSVCSQAESTNKLSYLKDRAPAMRKSVMDFWVKYGADKEFGAFHGTLNREGKPIDPTYKGLFQTGRHLWSMSYYYNNYGKDPKVKALADDLYKFMTKNFYKGGRLHFKVAENGGPLPDGSGYQTQANFFGMYGLATYAKVFKNKQAQQLTLNLYNAWRSAAWDDKFGGYNEAKDDPNWNPSGVVKSISVQTHGAEVLGAVYEATGSPQVAKDLVQLTELCATKIIGNAGRIKMHFKEDWTPVEDSPATIDFSAEMQTWMLLDIVEQHPSLFKPAVRKNIIKLVLSALRHALKYSYDEETGSFCMKGPVDKSCVSDKERTWYAQTEGVVGLYKLWKYSKGKEASAYLDKLAKAIKWVSEKQIDSTYGEMFYTIDLAGKPVGSSGDWKGSEWKASYHSGRMVMFLEGWLKKN